MAIDTGAIGDTPYKLLAAQVVALGGTVADGDSPYILQQKLLAAAQTVGESGGGVSSGSVDPVDPPGTGQKIYFRTDTGAIWLATGSTWTKKVGP